MVYLPTYILVEFYGNCKEKYDTQIILSVKGDWLNVVEDCLNIIEYRSSSWFCLVIVDYNNYKVGPLPVISRVITQVSHL